MASSLQLILFSSFIFFLPISDAHSTTVVALPVTKDISTLQYVTQILKGTPLLPIKLAIDLGGPLILINSASGCVSSTHQPIKCGSLRCSIGNGNCSNNHNHTCGHYAENTLTKVSTRAELSEDIIAVGSNMGSITTVHSFLFSCAPRLLLLNGLPSGVKGILGLGRSKIALPTQLANTFGFHRKFAVCLSPSAGVILSGDHHFISLSGTDISRSLKYTPLVTTYQGDSGTTILLEEYYISIKSIKINNKRLSINPSLLSIDQQGIGGTKISTIVPYTTMESTIYDIFTKAYIKIATSMMNMTMVAPMAPFGVCFSSKGIDKTSVVGPTMPVIDLVLQSEMVKWGINGRNSMVKMSDEVMCLGFLDGGLSPKASIVIGGYQLEDNLLEFDLGTSMLGFSSSLLMRQTSCSDFKLYSMASMPSELM